MKLDNNNHSVFFIMAKKGQKFEDYFLINISNYYH